ncbi:MAG: ribosome maturation factor RimP [Cyclobacteriaceae bacterium]|nr:ribosome maturation factor RimP [Cyclobacteriaceae bacterium]
MGGPKDDIAKIVTEKFPDDAYFLVDVAVKGNPGNEKIVILIDGDQGVDIETCSAISRAVSEELDRMDVFGDSYSLEVSSPGIDYPLETVRQYRKNVGKPLLVVFHDDKNIRGELTDVNDQGISIRYEQGGKKQPPVDTYIPYKDIKKSKVLVTFK